jgi:hypothetical protein
MEELLHPHAESIIFRELTRILSKGVNGLRACAEKFASTSGKCAKIVGALDPSSLTRDCIPPFEPVLH